MIENSTHTDKSNLTFVVKFGMEVSQETMAMSIRNEFSYDIFLWPWDKSYEWQYWRLHDLINRPKANANNVGKSATKLEFKSLNLDKKEIFCNITSDKIIFTKSYSGQHYN
jgi:hypothetical protein